MAEDRRTATTLDQLEAARVAVETEYLECMHGLEIHADALRAVVGDLALLPTDPEELTADETDSAAPAAATIALSAVEPPHEVALAALTLPTAGLRGWLVGWLLGDVQSVIDQREAAVEAAMGELRADLGRLRDDVSEVLERLQKASTVRIDSAIAGLRATLQQQKAAQTEACDEDSRRWRGVGEVLDRVVEGLTQATRLSERLRAVVDAKDAEGLQRAVQGPALQIEVIIDELMRRQEALLAELVGRRQELDELVASVSRGD